MWVQLPERQFPAVSEVGRWAQERLWCGECDVWLRNLRACLPRALPGVLERRLIQFPEWGVEAARDLRQPDFLRLITAALSSLGLGVWESLLHDSTSPKLSGKKCCAGVWGWWGKYLSRLIFRSIMCQSLLRR